MAAACWLKRASTDTCRTRRLQGRNAFEVATYQPAFVYILLSAAADIPRMPGNDIQNAAARIAQFQAVADVMTRRIELECRRR